MLRVSLRIRCYNSSSACQAEGFTTSVLRLLAQDLRNPDHTTLSRRSRSFAGGP